jgi:negative regulator of flagellin synthesis FlgM
MKIHQVRDEGQNLQPINQGMKPSPSEKNSAPPNMDSPVSVSDRVELSPQSRDMKKIHEILAATPEMRTEKVAELRKAITEGTYKVKAEDIADKMIQEFILELNR